MKLSRVMNKEFMSAYIRLMKSELPMSAAIKLKRISIQVTEAQDMYEEMRKELLNKYGQKNQHGELLVDDHGMVKMSREAQLEFSEKHKELLDVEVECNSVNVSELSTIKISAHDLMLLDGIVVE